MSRDSYNKRVLGKELYDKVSNSRILLVGAGGIGCELLKNLVLSGFKTIEVIDLDTIDISNLNRQFLFQRQHVKQAKAHVAKESALKFNSSVNIISHMADIKSPQYNVQWFKQFTLVLNALDNLGARRHVNAMCLAANVPLIESGTQGYLGQTYVIKKDVTECFDCQPKPTPTTYPVCTIRSTPNAPIHCVVWAKSFLFSQLFGNAEEEDLQTDESEENAEEIKALGRETEELKAIKDAMGSSDYARKVFEKVYNVDIDRLLSMESMWKNRKKPSPLDFDALESQMDDQEDGKDSLPDQKVWTLKESFEQFKSSSVRLANRLLEDQKTRKDAILAFDKDDVDAMDFVTAAANLRAHIFGITEKSLFDIKSMAGNIIPAIATTNAIIAGLVVMKTFGVLRGEIKDNQRTYLTTGSRLVQEANSEPNPLCGVCKSRNSTLLVNFEKATINDIIDKALVLPIEEGGAGIDLEDIAILEGNRMLYDIDEEENAKLLLKELSLTEGKVLRIEGSEQDIDLLLEAIDENETEVAKLLEPIPKPNPKHGVKHGVKRPREEDEEEEEQVEAKKTKLQVDESGALVIEDDDELTVLNSNTSFMSTTEEGEPTVID